MVRQPGRGGGALGFEVANKGDTLKEQSRTSVSKMSAYVRLATKLERD